MQEIFINMKTGNIGFFDIPIHTGYEDLKGNISWFKDLYKKILLINFYLKFIHNYLMNQIIIFVFKKKILLDLLIT